MGCIFGFECPTVPHHGEYAHGQLAWRSGQTGPARPHKSLLSEVLARYQLQVAQGAAYDEDEDDFSGSDYSDDEESMNGCMPAESPSSSATSSPSSAPIPIPTPRSLPYSAAWHRARLRVQQAQQQASAAAAAAKHMAHNNYNQPKNAQAGYAPK